MGYAVLAGVVERLRLDRGLGDVPRPALLLATLHHDWYRAAEPIHFEDVERALLAVVAGTPADYADWYRLLVEPQLQRRSTHVDGLHELTHGSRFPAIAADLLREWLSRHPDLPHAVEREMVDALLMAGDLDTARTVAAERRARVLPDLDAALYWLSVDWVADFEVAGPVLKGIGGLQPDFLFSLRDRLGIERRGAGPTLSIGQVEWLVTEFRAVWPSTERPRASSGRSQAWDATELLRGFIDRLSGDPSGEAGAAFDRLVAVDGDGYTDHLLHAAAEQRQLRGETEFRPVQACELRDLLTDGPPSDVGELRALVLQLLEEAQAVLRGGDTDRVVEFWDDAGAPRDENRCRDRIADLLEPELARYGVHRIPERDMPAGKRADLAFAIADIQLPMEVKGQWHPEVWDAAGSQLDRLYLRDWRARDHGIFLVLWFGDVPTRTRRRLKRPPDGDPPATAAEMGHMLVGRLPPARRGSIAVVVLDLTR